jgi:hypothetical protein
MTCCKPKRYPPVYSQLQKRKETRLASPSLTELPDSAPLTCTHHTPTVPPIAAHNPLHPSFPPSNLLSLKWSPLPIWTKPKKPQLKNPSTGKVEVLSSVLSIALTDIKSQDKSALNFLLSSYFLFLFFLGFSSNPQHAAEAQATVQTAHSRGLSVGQVYASTTPYHPLMTFIHLPYHLLR